MVRIVLVFCMAAAFAQPSLAAWYWPFSSGGDGERPRLSEILEPASLLIDEATDLAADGKTSEAVERYREALVEIDRVEREHADLVDGPEYNSVRNKRAYVNAAIDSLLLSEATRNARPVAVTDTTELQKRYDERRQAQKQEKRDAPENAAPAAAGSVAQKRESDVKAGRGPVATGAPAAPESREARLKLAVEDLKAGDYDSVDLLVEELLQETPNDAAALNMKAAAEIGRGKFRDAEKTLDRAIMSNPRSYYAYYNMARLMLEHGVGNRDAARRYYETGRQIGGPANAGLEKELK
ncbi:MAG: tetratricopeptide repeat protein [Kiritimatiellae bacterium]|nr:tetratricopeptide repeat protein [Kiritimatiellia bacterium]